MGKTLFILYTCIQKKCQVTAWLKGWSSPATSLLIVTDKHLPFPQKQEVVESFGYQSLAEKTCLMWEQVYRKFGSKYDYFVKIDDDTFVFRENLLAKIQETLPEFFGNYSRWRTSQTEGINWVSGSLYGLSKTALEKLVHYLKDPNKRKTFINRGPAEDVSVSVAMAEMGIQPTEWPGIFISEKTKTVFTLLFKPLKIISITNLKPSELLIFHSIKGMLEVIINNPFNKKNHRLDGDKR